MEVLRARLLDLRVAEQEAERSRMRKSQVGTGDRSAKIRTYNYPQSRITDHRIGFTTHDLSGVMDGHIDPLVEALKSTHLVVKRQAAEALGELGDEGVVEPLCQALQDPEVAGIAAEVLGELRDRRAVVPLRRAQESTLPATT